jgi:hypothetical protein
MESLSMLGHRTENLGVEQQGHLATPAFPECSGDLKEQKEYGLKASCTSSQVKMKFIHLTNIH